MIEGQPKQACIYKLKDTFDSTAAPIGFAIAVAALMLFFVLIFHYGLYMNDEERARRKGKGKKFIFD